MTRLRVVFDTNTFSPLHFDAIDNSPIRDLCRRGRVVAVYSGPFFEEMLRAYTRESVRDALLRRWFPFIIETGVRFHEDVPTIWQRELVQGAGLKVNTLMKPASQAAMVARLRALPTDGSWALIQETKADREFNASQLVAQRELSKEMRAEISDQLKARGMRGVRREVGGDIRRRLIPVLGSAMIERHVAPSNWRAVADRWARAPERYRYFTQFVDNMAYKEAHFSTTPGAPIDVNAQVDLDLMTFLLDADVFVTNEQRFARQAFEDLWRPHGKMLFSSAEFAAFCRRL